ncbi:quinolinate synthase NadA [Archaeoglobus veneficus]|uniref:Quinolinate synthase n=1 Tax=Archaeoglobus veneficus (strain DSM 11195 / SNP6) TaxID=693661 RepID=F2KQ18_ARCVS|nr:quinolinate synthase NadA [Archaeoglobus veneficus]AEA47621.1 Quinolinate synthase A [Archaeoglobus veneficus SNP6]
MEIKKRILKLKDEKNAVILAHNYQNAEIQEIADFIGDSLELARTAAKTKADIIVFCGVDFMAETAAVLNPDKLVLIPSKDARCPMAAQLPPEKVVEAKRSGCPFVIYVNSYAASKAEADICCTSANAAKVVESLDSDTVMLGPDANLAWFAARKTGKKVIAVPSHGYCYVHKAFRIEDVRNARSAHPDAKIIVHPECDPEVQIAADFVGSTSQMYRYAMESDAEKFVVGTEIGLIERMRREIEGKEFIPLRHTTCIEMKLNTLERIHDVLLNEKNVVKIDLEIADGARKAIRRMLEVA